MSSLRRKLNQFGFTIEAAKASSVTLYVASRSAKPPTEAQTKFGPYGTVSAIDYKGFRANPDKFANYPGYHYIFKAPGMRVLDWEKLKTVTWKNRAMFVKRASAFSHLGKAAFDKASVQKLVESDNPLAVLQQSPVARGLSYYDTVLKLIVTYADPDWLRQFDAALIAHGGLTKYNHPDTIDIFDWALTKIDPTPIDGTIKRFVGEKDTAKLQIPKSVVEALNHYTTKAQRKLDPAAMEWLKKNLPKKTKPMRLYRGIGFMYTPVLQTIGAIEKKRGKEWLNTLDGVYEAIDVLSRRWITLPVTDIKVGAKAVLQKKQSSFSTLKGVTKMFATQGNAFVGVVVEAIVKPEQIIADLSDLPAGVFKALPYFAQSEVLVEGPIEAKIIEVVGDNAAHWLNPPKPKKRKR